MRAESEIKAQPQLTADTTNSVTRSQVFQNSTAAIDDSSTPV